MRRWEEIFSEEERAVGQSRGNRKRQDFGSKPALLIIDVNHRTLGTREADLQAVAGYKSALWAAGWAVLPNIQRLLHTCRTAEIPVVFLTGDAVIRHYLRVSPKAALGKGGPGQDRKPDLDAEDIPEDIAPLPTELVIHKTRPSAFFRTPLDECLRAIGVDCLLVGGNSTSGCVRASVVDASSLGYRVFVVEECCYDRLELSHLVNLFDMNLKYADVITLEEALAQIARTQKAKPLASGREKVGKSA
ncbi:MAG: isochorismatase family protein [Chloroflexi bacterium]|nr:isochorismatase family protein [Chloroflexota bacterium]